jgi:hypothetical protein
MKPLLEYSTIIAAIEGDNDAISRVLDYYAGYIQTLATDDYFDREAHCRMVSKLLMALLRFRV